MIFRRKRLSLIISIFSGKSCFRMTSLYKIFTAGLSGCLPVFLISRVSIFCEKFIKVWKMIRRVSKRTVWYKTYMVIFLKPHFVVAVNRNAENLASLLSVIENTFSITPAAGSKEKCHGKIFFTVRSRTIGILCAVRFVWPAEIARIRTTFHIHVFLSPFPDAVKNILAVHLKGHHHAVRHTFCTGIIITRIFHISGIIFRFKIKMIRIFLVKNVIPAPDYTVFNIKFRITKLFQYTFHN